MKIIYLLCFFIIGIECKSQSFEIPREEYPFYNIIEWKGVGGMLMNRDPSGNARKINLTLVSNLQTSTWNQSFNPKGKDVYYISSENARYTYFLDNLELESGKYFFSQLSSAGSVKTSSSLLTHLLTMIFKNLGEFDFNEMKIIDIVTTDKALVHIFRYHNKKERKYTEIAIFMTHHNLISYACILGDIKEASLYDGFSDHWKYIGSTGDHVYFATRGIQTKKKGWAVKVFNSKAEAGHPLFIFDSDLVFEPIENKGFGTTGKHYLNQKGEIASNILTHFNGHFYLTGIALENGRRELKSLKLNEGKWEVFSTFPLQANLKGKDITKLGIYPINEGLGVKIVQPVVSTIVFMPFEKNKNIILSLFNENITFNPSRMIINERKQDFAVNLPDRNVFFAYNLLNNTGNIKFDFIKR